MIAALFVAKGGIYYDLPNVDPWDEQRDARKYAGPHPVIAHPPCKRWGNYWSGGPPRVFVARGLINGFDAVARDAKYKLGDDGGCFIAALEAVRTFGGVLEHPLGSHAWKFFGLARPPRRGGWVIADRNGGWTCCVEQGAYGHRGRKATWLYANKIPYLPGLRWRAAGDFRYRQAQRGNRPGVVSRMSHEERAATPTEFRDLLINLVEPCRK